MSAKYKCSAKVWKGWTEYGCGKTAGYEHEGEHFCKTHHPPTVVEKNRVKREAWEAQWKLRSDALETERAAIAEQKRRADLFPELLDALKRAVSTVECEYGRNSCAAYRALIAKAEGKAS